MKDPKKVAAGKARSQALTPDERSAIARRAALTRHRKDLPSAIAEGVLVIGDMNIPCAVLDDEHNTRVLTQNGFLRAMGRHPFAAGGTGASIDGTAPFLRAKNLKPFVSEDLERSTVAIQFLPRNRTSGAAGVAYGYRAQLLPQVCWVYQDALIEGKLAQSQEHIGKACRNFLKALTNYAIDDLVDRATGFEDIRKRAAIDKIIEKYVRPDAQTYAKMFDLEFYRHIFRLNNWPFDPEKTARPGVVGTWTNDIYDRLAPGVKSALHAKVRRNEKGKPTQKLTQYLTPEEGKPKLEKLLEGIILLMRMSSEWSEFKLLLDKWYPRFDDTLQLPLGGGFYKLPRPDA